MFLFQPMTVDEVDNPWSDSLSRQTGLGGGVSTVIESQLAE